MAERVLGKTGRIVGPVVEACEVVGVEMLELVFVGEERLVGEVVRLKGDRAWIQVYEDTTGLRPGAPVFGRGEPLSIELGPGLIGSIYDGVQRPLDVLRAQTGDFVSKGVHAGALDRDRKWEFRPLAQAGQDLAPGAVIGTVKETEVVEHSILVPPGKRGRLVDIVGPGQYGVEDVIGRIAGEDEESELRLYHRWPVRRGRPIARRKAHRMPLITGQRVLDTLFPIAKGGVVVVPGGFGTGKTMVQHALAKWCDADIVVYIGCGERGNEMTEVLLDFPRLTDPRTGRYLMERTILIANTSNMPVAAREASIYTGITMAEYYSG